MTKRRRIDVIIGAVLVLTVPSLARAEPDETNEDKAERLFRSGEKKFDAGKYAEACADFQSSLKLAPKLGTLLNVALCHETTGKPATAWAEFHHAAAWATQNGQKDRREFALQHISVLEPKLPRVGLQLPATSVIASLDLDGEPLPEQRWYLPLFLDPGEHAVAVSAPGKQRTTVRFRVVDSPTEQLVVIPSLPDDPNAGRTEPPRPSGGIPTWAAIVIGAGAFVAGGALGYVIAR
jgi:hypothetical protein